MMVGSDPMFSDHNSALIGSYATLLERASTLNERTDFLVW